MKVGSLGVLAVVVGVWASAGVLEVLPPGPMDERVPTLAQVLGYDWGEEISDPDQIRRYAERLAEAAPQRVRLIPYANSLEGRQLFLLVVGRPELVAHVDELARKVRELGDPRLLSATAQQTLVKELPAVVWLVGSVHGDEASGGEAVLALAYYLAAAGGAPVEDLFKKVIVILDPMQNPDGRARFVASTRQSRGLEPALEPVDAEHVQPWPGGRFSHLLFDLNRDWFVLTHPESRGRVEKMLWLPPQVVVDLHEMGAEQGYFFPPPADPHNPLVSQQQSKLWELLGKQLSEAFDAAGIRFWTREVFDAFYPGYGESWPFFTGACGATFEQASTSGRAVRLSTGEVLRYQDAVAHHLLAAFVTVTTVAENKEAFMESWLSYRQRVVTAGHGKAFTWQDLGAESEALAGLLARQGLEVYRVDSGALAGHYVVPQGQPLGNLAQVLLTRDVPLPPDFAEKQRSRERQRRPHEIYDVTAWSLPLLWNVPVEEKALDLPKGAKRIPSSFQPVGQVTGEGRVAFVMPWDGLAAARALVALLRAGITARVAEAGFRLHGRDFPRGSVVVFRRQNSEDLQERLRQLASSWGVSFFGVNSSFAESGIDLGSNRVRPVKLPSVALLWDFPASPTAAGHLRYALEYQLGLPVTAIRAQQLAHAELSKFQVVVLPDGFSAQAYAQTISQEVVEKLKHWVEEGGVLVAEGEAAAFLAQEKVKLLASKLEKRSKEPEKEGEGKGSSYQEAILPDEEDPPMVPGAILKVELDGQELLTAGFPDKSLHVLVNSRRVFRPLKLDAGRNLGVFAEGSQLLASGFLFEDSRRLLAKKAYLMMQRHGRGLVLAFAEPPAFRGMTKASTLLLANSVLFAPAVAGRR